MPSNRAKKGSKMLGFWITEAERKLMESEMKSLGIKNMTDYIRHKMELPPLPKGGDAHEKEDGE
jgi:hypothetical protein